MTPPPLSLEQLTPDVTKAAYLERMLDKNAASYKHYWLRAIVEELAEGHREMSFTALVARMVASAWYPVVYFHLSLGASDKLAELIAHLQQRHRIANDERPDRITYTVVSLASADERLARLIRDRTHNVPYRLIRPFYEDELAAIRRADPRWYDTKTDTAIFELNRRDPRDCIYQIAQDRLSLTVAPDWADFITANMPVIQGWLDYRLAKYLQARNPSVPAIIEKLRPPRQRDLSAATSYWRLAMQRADLREVYTGEPLTMESLSSRGGLSIDHFVPWSFVMHDEAWNLLPMARNLNSSKSDRLPQLERYLQPLCRQHFDALIATRGSGAPRAVIESYLTIDPHVLEYEDSPASRQRFAENLQRTITPLYQIALNQGYAVWSA